MAVFSLVLNMIGGLCMFLFGMKKMSEGLQKSAGDRMRKTLDFMTGNRFMGVFTGFMVTAIVQSSTAVTVMLVSFVNAGLLTLTQSVGVIFGTNIGTTLTGWFISIIGFKIKIDSLALPAIGIGFVASFVKWKYRSIGDFLLGFGFLFLGLHFLTSGMGTDAAKELLDFHVIGALGGKRYLAILIGFGVGLVMTIIINSSTASITLIMALAFQGIVPYEMAAGMVMGSNLGTTLTAPLASLNGNTEAKRTAMVHVMFNIIGVAWAVPMLIPLLKLVNIILPGDPWAAFPGNEAIPLHIAGLHTVFNIINTALFLPFVNPYSKFIKILVRGKVEEKQDEHYKFSYVFTGIADSPELNIMRVEKEISNMAGVVSFMYSKFCDALRAMHETPGNCAENASVLCEEMQKKVQYVGEMREALTNFLIECSRVKLTPRSEARITRLLRVIVNLDEMSDECYSISRLLEKCVAKDCVFKNKEMKKLIPYVGEVEEFLGLLEDELVHTPTAEQKERALELEEDIDRNRKKLNKLSRKRIKAGENIRKELLFIDMVRRIEKLGDYCFDIANTL